ncbi:MAG TPA: IS701 family transposase [Terriglobales bacterium]|nr:IS701 family transposase [Terriglobales bacterium]
MSANSVAPGAQQKRFAAYLDRLAHAAGHLDRVVPLKSYCMGLLLPGERKSVEPMAARLCPDNVRQTHQSLHHVVAHAPWSDEDLLQAVRQYTLPAMQKQGPIVAWVVDDTGLVKKGTHSVGVTRQYCGQVGKQENCRVAVSLSLSTAEASLPIAWQLYLPEVWTEDKKRRASTGVPPEIRFQTKPEIALQQLRAAVDRELPHAPVLADAAYGNDTRFRDGITDLGLLYAVGIQSSVSAWAPGQAPLPKRKWKGIGRPTKLLRRDSRHAPLSVRELAMGLPLSAWKMVGWREGTRKTLRSRFAALRIRPAHRDDWRSEPRAEEWLLIEWPREEAEPIKYWLSTLPENMKLRDLVRLAKHRWIIERDYQELKQELGLGHYEGRGWRGFHHHATLCIAAYGFLVAERSRFSPSARAGHVDLPVAERPRNFRPRGSPGARGAA